MLMRQIMLVLTATGLTAWAAFPNLLTATPCLDMACMPQSGWICAASSQPDPEDVMWNWCNRRTGSDPFEWECSLPE